MDITKENVRDGRNVIKGIGFWCLQQQQQLQQHQQQ